MAVDKNQVWRPFVEEGPSFVAYLSKVIADMQATQRYTFPDLRSSTAVALVSDYSGDKSPGGYQTFSFLLTDPCGIWEWDDLRTEIRSTFPDSRRIGFKNLNDGVVRRAPLPFLEAANTIDGVLLSVAFHRSTPAFLRDSEQTHMLNFHCSAKWRAQELEKMVRICEFGTMVVASMCSPKQEVHWITDDDAIVANHAFQADVFRHAAWRLAIRAPKPLGVFKLGIAGLFDDERMAEDLAAIPDLACGALVEFLPTYVATVNRGGSGYLPHESGLALKSHFIMDFLRQEDTRLKKITCVLRGREDGHLDYHFPNWNFRIGGSAEKSQFKDIEKWQPIFDKYLQDSV